MQGPLQQPSQDSLETQCSLCKVGHHWALRHHCRVRSLTTVSGTCHFASHVGAGGPVHR